jgi:phosphoserine phosphatase
MYAHVLHFDSILQKRAAIDWIRENIGVFDENEHLTEKRYTFYTELAVPERTQRRLKRTTQPLEYLIDEL